MSKQQSTQPNHPRQESHQTHQPEQTQPQAPTQQLQQLALDYFLEYVKYETTSNPKSDTTPSDPNVFQLAKKIVEDLQALGLNAKHDDKGYVYSSLPATAEASHTLGLIAHMDTSPDFTAKNVNPRRVTYDGTPIILNEEREDYREGREEAIILAEDYFPQLKKLRGDDLIVTDGHTLLGADDKAGIAEIMALANYLTKHPEIPHGEIKIGFTPDEEVGRGADHFDVEGFGADVAYTLDGSSLGELEWENFNAASAKVTIRGLNVHPGSAKNKMINAVLLAGEFMSQFPEAETPQHTEGYEGFYHLNEIAGDVERVDLEYIIRDHDHDKFEARKTFMQDTAQKLNDKHDKHGKHLFEVVITDQYYNMKEQVRPYPFLIDYAKEAMQDAGVTPNDVPIRGGTDGARLSYMGLPCPNLFTGGDNFHGRYEYLSIGTMAKAAETLFHLVQKFVVH